MSDEPPCFLGVAQLLEMIRGLYERPRALSWSQEREIRGDHPLPLIYLQHDRTAADFLSSLAAHILEHAPDAPVIRVDAAAVVEQTSRRWMVRSPDPAGEAQDDEASGQVSESNRR